MEDLISQIDKLDVMFDYIQNQTNDEKETGQIISKLGLDNPHFSRLRGIDEYKQLADKLIMFRKMLK